jgi:hypothetical protein
MVASTVSVSMSQDERAPACSGRSRVWEHRVTFASSFQSLAMYGAAHSARAPIRQPPHTAGRSLKGNFFVALLKDAAHAQAQDLGTRSTSHRCRPLWIRSRLTAINGMTKYTLPCHLKTAMHHSRPPTL